jgi:c-di-GMP-binding flagellar brake protein YcgR
MDTRQAPRHKITLAAKIRVNEVSAKQLTLRKDVIDVQVIDLSVLGIGMVSQSFIPKGMIIDIELLVNSNMLNLKGEVRSAISAGKGLTRLGVQFIELKDKDSQVLKDFIHTYERRAEPRLNVPQ